DCDRTPQDTVFTEMSGKATRAEVPRRFAFCVGKLRKPCGVSPARRSTSFVNGKLCTRAFARDISLLGRACAMTKISRTRYDRANRLSPRRRIEERAWAGRALAPPLARHVVTHHHLE